VQIIFSGCFLLLRQNSRIKEMGSPFQNRASPSVTCVPP